MRKVVTSLLALSAACAMLVAPSSSSSAAAGAPPVLKPLGPAVNDCAVLDSVVALSATDAWAVGGNVCTSPTALIEHWDGRHVTRVPLAQLHKGNDVYPGIAAAGPSNVWAVGGNSSSGPGGGDVGLVARWNGSAWRLVPGPTGNHFESYLNEIRLAPNGDAWMAGEVGFHAALMRVHGGKSSVVTLASAGTFLHGLYVASATNVWAGGSGYLVHGDGTHWQVMQAPNGVDIRRMAGSGPSNIWAIAGTSSGSALLHFDGHHWVTTAISGSAGPYLVGLTVRGGDTWLSGSTGAYPNEVPYVSHWNGKTLTTVPVQLPSNAAQGQINGISATAHGLFAVGNVWSPSGFQGHQWWSTNG